jgi:hypothetical protein
MTVRGTNDSPREPPDLVGRCVEAAMRCVEAVGLGGELGERERWGSAAGLAGATAASGGGERARRRVGGGELGGGPTNASDDGACPMAVRVR